MRRVTLMLAGVAMMVSLFAVAAYAAEITGTGNSEQLGETNRADTIKAFAGDDKIFANQFAKSQTPGGDGDTDRCHGGAGDDYCNVRDGDGSDTAWGGKGIDYCDVDLATEPGVEEGGDQYHGCEFINGVEQ